VTVGLRRDPYRVFNFAVALLDSSAELMSAVRQIEQIKAGGFKECSGLESTIDVEEYKEGGNNSAVLKFPTRASASPIQLKRGITANDDLWAWHNGFILGRGKRRDGLIVLQNEARDPVKVWAFYRGIPTKYTGPSLNATENEVALEQLEIVHEGLALVSPAGSLSSLIGAVSSAAETIGSLFD
jgi:phage tail-like protein